MTAPASLPPPAPAAFAPDVPDEILPPAVRSALVARGFTALTPVQEAVIDPDLAGRDLRIFSQTGSGKTVAVGLAIAPQLAQALSTPADGKGARPFALMVAPTRELATQIAGELSWLFAPLGAQVTAVTGGASYPRELAALRRGPQVIAGTPGRLLDHLSRKAIDPSALGVLVLDEADQMLDMGFRDELLAILEQLPEERRTLLLSATFPREVQRLADRCQKDPVVAAGSGAHERHADIAHVAHIVLHEQRDDALVNLLLMAPGERALVFVRTREGASELADALSDAGLPARAIHGDMEQRDRTRTLGAFRSGAVTTLVATDVAARGLDIADVTRVIHADPPGDAEVLTHRSGRTGRAGKKGTSVMLVPPGAREKVKAMLHRAGVEASWSPAPSAADVLRAADDRLAAELTSTPEAPPDPRLQALAAKLLASTDAAALVTALLARAEHRGPCAPREVTPMTPPAPRAARVHPARDPARFAAAQGQAPEATAGFVPFRINWGERHRADPRRLLALVCRRGNIRGSDVGAIRIGTTVSTFEVGALVAAAFAKAAQKPDARDPRIHIEPLDDGPAQRAPAERFHEGPTQRAPAERFHEGPARRAPAERSHEETGPRPRPARAASPPPAHGQAPPKRRPARPR